MAKLSSAIYEATIKGDTTEIERLKNEIDDRATALVSKPKDQVVDFNTVLNNDKASAKKIYDFLNKAFGADWWEWETETLEHMLWIHYAVALEGINRDKVFAIRHLCNSDRSFFDWHEFNQLSLSFAGAMADFDMLRTPSIGMVVNMVKAMNYIRPDRESRFGGDVIRYICVLMKNEGLYVPPPSIASIISEYFSTIISDEMKALWPAILNRFNELITGKDIKILEDPIDIQARRLVSAEASALTYGT